MSDKDTISHDTVMSKETVKIEDRMKNTMGSRIKTVRIHRGLSRSGLCKILGIHRATLRNLENDKRNPSVRLLRCLCVTLWVTSDYILGLESTYDMGRKVDGHYSVKALVLGDSDD